jgi:hypothetical protein
MSEKDHHPLGDERRAFLKGTLLAAGSAALVSTSPSGSQAESLLEAQAGSSDPMPARLAEIGYSKESREIQLIVPSGTRVADLSKAMEFLARDVFSKLPRGCTACTSGDHLIIRERLEHVIRVDLDRRVILGR